MPSMPQNNNTVYLKTIVKKVQYICFFFLFFNERALSIPSIHCFVVLLSSSLRMKIFLVCEKPRKNFKEKLSIYNDNCMPCHAKLVYYSSLPCLLASMPATIPPCHATPYHTIHSIQRKTDNCCNCMNLSMYSVLGIILNRMWWREYTIVYMK